MQNAAPAASPVAAPRAARPLLPLALQRAVQRFIGLPPLQRFVADHSHLRGLAFVEAALDFLDCRYLVDPRELEHLPEQGPVLVVANHPLGGIDALLLLACLGRVRPDLRIVANDWLAVLEPLRELLLPVPVDAGGARPAALRALHETLARGEVLVMFPAAEVSRLSWRGIRDRAWHPGFLRLAQRAGAAVLPVRVGGRNSALFYGASLLHRPLGAPLLVRELARGGGTRVTLRLGEPRRAADLDGADRRDAARTVRGAVYALGTPRSQWRAPQAPLTHRPPLARLRDAVDALPLLGRTPDGKRIHAGPLASDSPLLHELGRLRELCFRAVGEGTGRRVDVDAYDTWYDHIVLWDEQRLEVAGAYRAARCAPLLAARGRSGLYSASLFELDAALDPMLAQGVELGRSFVAPAHQNSRALDALWAGIGAWLQRQPEVRWLFGPVSISVALPPRARDWLVGYYQRYYGEADALARPAHPYRYAQGAPQFGPLGSDEAFARLRRELDALGAKIPVLYRQYVDLCEPGGVSFLAFGVDPDFAGSTDGLLRLDLTRLRPSRVARYLGRPQGAS